MPIQKKCLFEAPDSLLSLCLDVVRVDFRKVAKSWLLNRYKADQLDPDNKLFLTAFDMMRNYYYNNYKCFKYFQFLKKSFCVCSIQVSVIHHDKCYHVVL